MNGKQKVAVLTQADGLVIPQNILQLSNLDGVEVVCVLQIQSQGALTNKSRLCEDSAAASMQGYRAKYRSKNPRKIILTAIQRS